MTHPDPVTSCPVKVEITYNYICTEAPMDGLLQYASFTLMYVLLFQRQPITDLPGKTMSVFTLLTSLFKPACAEASVASGASVLNLTS